MSFMASLGMSKRSPFTSLHPLQFHLKMVRMGLNGLSASSTHRELTDSKAALSPCQLSPENGRPYLLPKNRLSPIIPCCFLPLNKIKHDESLTFLLAMVAKRHIL